MKRIRKLCRSKSENVLQINQLLISLSLYRSYKKEIDILRENFLELQKKITEQSKDVGSFPSEVILMELTGIYKEIWKNNSPRFPAITIDQVISRCMAKPSKDTRNYKLLLLIKFLVCQYKERLIRAQFPVHCTWSTSEFFNLLTGELASSNFLKFLGQQEKNVNESSEKMILEAKQNIERIRLDQLQILAIPCDICGWPVPVYFYESHHAKCRKRKEKRLMIKDADSIFLQIDASVVNYMKLVQTGKFQAKLERQKEKFSSTIERMMNPSASRFKAQERKNLRQEKKKRGFANAAPLGFAARESETEELKRILQKIKNISTSAYRINDSNGEMAVEMLKKLQKERDKAFPKMITDNNVKVLLKNLITRIINFLFLRNELDNRVF